MPMRSKVSVPESFEMEEAVDGEFAWSFEGVPHQVEAEVSQALRESPGIYVESLSVHQVEGGVCLHGVVEVDDAHCDLEEIVRQVVRVDQVINRMIVRPGRCTHPECSSTELGFTGEWA